MRRRVSSVKAAGGRGEGGAGAAFTVAGCERYIDRPMPAPPPAVVDVVVEVGDILTSMLGSMKRTTAARSSTPVTKASDRTRRRTRSFNAGGGPTPRGMPMPPPPPPPSNPPSNPPPPPPPRDDPDKRPLLTFMTNETTSDDVPAASCFFSSGAESRGRGGGAWPRVSRALAPCCAVVVCV